MDSQKIMNSSSKSAKASLKAPQSNKHQETQRIPEKICRKNNKQKQEVGMSNVTFKVEKMFRLPEAGSLKAFADVSVNDALIIRGVRILEGKKGIFVSMPKEQGKDNKWYDQVTCTSAEVFEKLSLTVMEHYDQKAAVAA